MPAATGGGVHGGRKRDLGTISSSSSLTLNLIHHMNNGFCHEFFLFNDHMNRGGVFTSVLLNLRYVPA